MEATDRSSIFPLKKIMFATDFSPVAMRAAQYVRALAQKFSSAVILVHVYSSFDEEISDSIAAEQQRCRNLLTAQQHEFEVAGITTSISLTSECPPPDALLLKERQLAPDLIVAGTESKSPVSRFFLGSTAEHLIRNASVPVLTVGPNSKPANHGPLILKRIVFATDFSDGSHRAGAFGVALTAESGAHLWICHVAGAEGAHTGTQPATSDAREQRFREELARLLPSGSYEWCNTESYSQHGSPGRGILDTAARVGADLIVMGARSRSFWLLHVRRGVTQDVLAHATCPVLTIH
ncbi:MAG TPA: universal stress protein [Acidobacteriaceae bacterium]|nr:universal stress protein [Acidobacteriaceae bacterium]